MKRTALILGMVAGLLCLGWNVAMSHDWLVAVTRAGIVTGVAAILALYAMRGVAQVLINQIRAQKAARANQEAEG